MSNVKEYAQRAVRLADFAQEVPVSLKDRRVTVRLDGIYYGALLLLSRRVLDSPTGCAESLLMAAIQDAIEGMGYETLEAALPDIRKVLGTDTEASHRAFGNETIPEQVAETAA